MNKILMTPEGYENLLKELNHFKSHERMEVISAIQTARAYGDLSENAEYHAAKEKQSIVEGKIFDLQRKINAAQVIDNADHECDVIAFGATVILRDEDTQNIHEYRIVGSDESDVHKGMLSVESPLGIALMGKRINDDVEFKAPSGNRFFVIEKIIYERK